MSGDFSRNRFDPRKHFTSVLMQQGRVQLDSDWNELQDVFDRRFRAERADTLGRHAVPRRTPDAFKITRVGERLTIGPGRMYVDGLMPENHGDPDPRQQVIDSVLHELRGPSIDYATGQPFFPTGNTPPPNSPYLVYLDVWQRDITFVEDPSIIEPAVGVDTSARTQTAWRVRILENVAQLPQPLDFDPLEKSPPNFWADLIRPPAGRLSTGVADSVNPDDDPCIIPPSGGFRGLENQLYRVEIHNEGDLGSATFKWSRDNASIAAQVTAVPGPRAVTVTSLGRDAVLRFNRGDWVELLDDRSEPDAVRGVLLRVKRVDDDARLLEFEADIPAAFTGTNDQVAARNTRVRRWDQTSASGELPVPDDRKPVVLEHGITVTFDVAPEIVPNGETVRLPFRSGDHWTFAARTATAQTETLIKAPARGNHHHYAPLAWIDPNVPDKVIDLRTVLPSSVGDPGPGECDVHVTAAGHALGEATIQKAINDLRKPGGGTICLGRGTFYITDESLRIEKQKNITIRGQGAHTVLIRQFTIAPNQFNTEGSEINRPELDAAAPLLRLGEVANITISDLVFISSASANGFAPAIAVRTAADLTFERCFFIHMGGAVGIPTPSPAIGLTGAIVRATVRDNVFVAHMGVAADRDDLLLADLDVTDNVFSAGEGGVNLDNAFIVHSRRTRIANNEITNSRVGIRVGGLVPEGGLVDIDGNNVETNCDGIVVSATRCVVRNNVVFRSAAALGSLGLLMFTQDGDGNDVHAGIGVRSPSIGEGFPNLGQRKLTVAGERLLDVRIDDNTISGFGFGVVAQARVQNIQVRRNRIDRTRFTGVRIDGDIVRGDTVAVVEGNTIRDVNQRALVATTGVTVTGIQRATIRDNTIERIGDFIADGQPVNVAAIAVNICHELSITGNRMFDIGPSGQIPNPPKLVVGLDILDVFETVHVDGNTLGFSAARTRHVACRAFRIDNSPSIRRGGAGEPPFSIFFSDTRLFLAPAVGRRALMLRGNNFNTVMTPDGAGAEGYAATIRQDGFDLAYNDNQLVIVVPDTVAKPLPGSYLRVTNATPPAQANLTSVIALLNNDFYLFAFIPNDQRNVTHVDLDNTNAQRIIGNCVDNGRIRNLPAGTDVAGTAIGLNQSIVR